ncbi:hypothetical protein DMB66_47530 [Actinoplanes sp. ATCC 53533]|uniref:hypothetical protein n=1 Tax=Actinoplanes sp. ATCC 53533 TaxID=1288362 RepID=UPI000F77FD7E|nr:hypothetical protein [Actinoplanes sp. ATCC 53533]RSM47787.1 hypothetical protein DMB66_47530 [Actinoplanes sp. ATCC 53533]
MYQNLPLADRRQRRDARPDRNNSHCVLVGEKEFFNPADPADYREYLIVRAYANPSDHLQSPLSRIINDLDER